VDAWTLRFDGLDPPAQGLREALCTLGNGYLATRGAFPEATAGDTDYPGTYVAGLYDRLTTDVAGRPIENEDLVNIPNWLPLTFRIDGGGWFRLDEIEVLSHHVELDMRNGILLRRARIRDVEDRVTVLTQRRFVSMADAHLAALETTFSAENWSGTLVVRSSLDGQVTNAGVPRYRALRGDHLVPIDSGGTDTGPIWLETETQGSHVRIGICARTRTLRDGAHHPGRGRLVEDHSRIGHDLTIELSEGESVSVEKLVAIYTSNDRAIYEPVDAARQHIARAAGFDALLRRHVVAWNQAWRRFDLGIDGPERVQLIVRLHVFHLLQSVSWNTIGLDVGVPARGLHGEAYRGHIFWDELFVVPYITLRLPRLTRTLLEYRFRRLPEARWAAAREGLRGACFPWQSGSSGREESQLVHLNPASGRWLPDNSRLQKHINIAVAYNVWQYHQVSSDWGFLRYYGAPMLLDIARYLAGITTYDRARGRYEIRGVMGPDEYHDAYPDTDEPGLNNNAYTNVMTTWVLRRALEVLDIVSEHHRQELWEEHELTREELDRWEDITRKMFVPFHDGIVSQFEGYGDLEEFGWEDYRARYGNIQRLDRILEAEGDTTNRYKLSKQADVLMLCYLLPEAEAIETFERLGYECTPETIMRTIDYYLARSAHGSTLSRVVHAWVIARHDPERSWSLFIEALESDIGDAQGGTTAEGIHLGAMAGTVDLVQRAYGGVDARHDVLWVDPALPPQLDGLRFEVHYRGHRLQLEITHERVVVRSLPGQALPMQIGIRDEIVELAAGNTIDRGL
jgi:alpha,alpha-trehalase